MIALSGYLVFQKKGLNRLTIGYPSVVNADERIIRLEVNLPDDYFEKTIPVVTVNLANPLHSEEVSGAVVNPVWENVSTNSAGNDLP